MEEGIMTQPDNSTATPAPDDQPPLAPPPGTPSDNGDHGDEGEPTPTDADGLARQLANERRSRRAAERAAADRQKQLDDLAKKVKAFEDRDKSNEQRATEALTAAQAETAAAAQRAEAAELSLLRHKVGLAKGVPAGGISRLQGTTREELEEDADRYLEEMGQQQQPGGPRPPKPDPRLGHGQQGKPSTGEQFAAALNPLL